ncbi:MAG: Asp-tRNA(Asn)/Glu-tRNA(Gln) amidotransferase subunit GatB, partial [Flavisolibacter sp.]
RGFDETDFSTYSIRTKEDEDDYRYFPEPDLPPFFITDEMIETIRKGMPPLQEEVRKKLMNEFQLSEYDAGLIADDVDLARIYFELTGLTSNYKAAANWVIGPIKNHLSTQETTSESSNIFVNSIADMILLSDEGKINYGIASQKIFPQLIQDPKLNVLQYIKDNELFVQTSMHEIDKLIEASLDKHSQKITEYKKGKKGLLSLFVGEVMKLSNGKADAKLVTEKIIQKLNARR